MGSRAWVLAIALGLVAVHTVSATNYTLGGAAGWTDTANINYTNELAAFTIKVGDTLIFDNYDLYNHSILLMPTQAAYDACDSSVATSGLILPPGYYYPYTFKEPHAEVYVICGYHCKLGQKVKFSVANADGTPAPGSSPTPSSPSPSPSPPTGPTASPPSPPSPISVAPPPPSTFTPASSPASSPAPTPAASPPDTTPNTTPDTTPNTPPDTTPDTPPDTTASSPPPPAARNATSANPFGFRNDAAGIARFGWFTIAVVCALSCYHVL